MLTWWGLLALGVAVTGMGVGVGVALAGALWPIALRRLPQLPRALAAGRQLQPELGRWASASVVLLAGTAATVAVCWPFGALAKRLQPTIDVPLFRFAQHRQDHHAWTAVNQVLTRMGDRPQVKAVCLVAAVLLAFLWRHRGWWLPPIVIATAFGVEKYTQQVLTAVVARGRPPGTDGTYPSGGCGRVLAVYGTILYLVLLARPGTGRRTRLALLGMLALAAFLEGYSRIYLLRHWFTDVVGGWLFGSLLLGVMLAGTALLLTDSRARPGGPPAAATASDAVALPEVLPAVTRLVRAPTPRARVG